MTSDSDNDLDMCEEPTWAPTWHEICYHNDRRCSCTDALFLPCIVAHFEEKQANLKKIQTLLKQHQSFQLENHRLKVESKELQSANNLLSSKIETLGLENLQLKVDNERFQRTNEIVQKENKSLEFQNDLLLKTSEELTKKNDELKTKLSKLTEELENSRTKLNKNISFLESSLAENTTLISKIQSLDTQLASFQKESRNSSIPKSEKSERFPKSISPKPKVNFAKPLERKVSQFTNYSLQKDRRYSLEPNFDGTKTPISFLSFEDNSFFISQAKSQLTNLKWKSNQKSQSTESKSFKYSLSMLFDLAPKHVQKVNDFISKNRFSDQVTPKTSPRSAKQLKPINSLGFPRFKDQYGWFSLGKPKSPFKQTSKPTIPPLKPKTNKDTKSTPLPKTEAKRKINDFFPLHPRMIFANETPSFHSTWNATSIHRIDETFIWTAKVKTIGPVLKWVPKVVCK